MDLVLGLVLTFIFVFGTIISAVLWFTRKEPVYKKVAFFWLMNIGQMAPILLSQKFAADSLLVEGVSANAWVCFFTIPILISIVQDLNEVDINSKLLIRWCRLTPALYITLAWFTRSFQLTLLIGSLICYVPLIVQIGRVSFRNWRSLSPVLTGFNVSCLLLLIHYCDYPFLRPVEAFAPFGFAIYTGITVGLMVFSLGAMIERLYKNYTHELEKNVLERTRELAQVQASLVQSSKMSALGEMAGGVAHEINTPLAIIKNACSQAHELLDDESIDKETIQKVLSAADRTVDRIAKIVSGLRTFSREGSKDPAKRIDLRSLVMETLDLCRERFQNGGVRLSVELSDSEVHVSGRTVEISQTILNLLNNAYDASVGSTESSIRISCSLRGVWAEIVVEDSGSGVSEAVRSKIFQPFFTTKDVGKGTGLGLSISRGIVESHGGSLTLDGSSSQTCFVIKLPSAS
jgi:signal transduction histidine kinase